MRATDVQQTVVMTSLLEDGSLRLTAQRDGIDVAHAFFRPSEDGSWRNTVLWISPRVQQHGIADDLREALQEAGWRDVAKAGILGAGLLGAGLGTMSPSTQPTQTTPAAITQPAQEPAAAAATDQQSPAAAVQKAQDHPNFPKQLKDLSSKDAETRVKAFTSVLLPVIDQQNAEIKAQRATLDKLAKSKTLTKPQREWLEGMMAYYKASDLRDLLRRVDIIPRSMALAQAAVESGWGQDALAQQANVFYGQKTFDPNAPSAAGQYGERYRAFDSPADSVRAYMRNLNTHPAYERFRDARQQLRHSGKPMQGRVLAPTLAQYSTKGDYSKLVMDVIRGRGLTKLDHD